jgi:hypothetical protein
MRLASLLFIGFLLSGANACIQYYVAIAYEVLIGWTVTVNIADNGVYICSGGAQEISMLPLSLPLSLLPQPAISPSFTSRPDIRNSHANRLIGSNNYQGSCISGFTVFIIDVDHEDTWMQLITPVNIWTFDMFDSCAFSSEAGEYDAFCSGDDGTCYVRFF